MCRLAFVLALLTGPAAAELRLSESFDSRALGRPMKYSVYLPDAPAPPGGYPVFFLLHGLGDDETSWPKLGRIEETMDGLIASGCLPPITIVMPDGGKSWYVDSAELGGPGDYARAIGEDLVAYVAATYPVTHERAEWGIGGHSMGGSGGLEIAFRYPAMFGYAGAMSPAPGPRFVARALAGEGMPDEQALRMLGGSFGVPFRPEAYVASMPETLVRHLDGAPNAPRVLLHGSDDDRFDTHMRAVAVYEAARAAGLEAELRITDGGHEWPVWRAFIPELLRVFLRAEPCAEVPTP